MAARGLSLVRFAAIVGSRRSGSIAHYSSKPNTLASRLDDLAAGEKKSGGGGRVFLGLLLIPAGFYIYTHPELVPDYVLDKIPDSVKSALPPFSKVDLPSLPPSPPVVIDPKEEFLKRVDSLKTELEELRKEKADKFVNLKKKEIKEELKIVQKAINEVVESTKETTTKALNEINEIAKKSK